MLSHPRPLLVTGRTGVYPYRVLLLVLQGVGLHVKLEHHRIVIDRLAQRHTAGGADSAAQPVCV